ncbi:MAG: DNA-binding protein [Rhodospirillaceae bacterium]|nr:DNA-binding protein [Rhodospirillaceae bacterium]
MSVPRPLPDGPDRQYAEHLKEGRLAIQRCGACSRHVFFPRLLCPHCHDDNLAWVEVSGQGTVHATTVIRKRPDQGPPHNLCLVDLDEGVRMTSRVEGLAPEDVVIGMAVTARITEQDGEPLVVFDPA